jgi:hypothetical protein
MSTIYSGRKVASFFRLKSRKKKIRLTSIVVKILIYQTPGQANQHIIVTIKAL